MCARVCLRVLCENAYTCICAESKLILAVVVGCDGNVARAIGLAGFICLSPFSVSTSTFNFALAFATDSAFALCLLSLAFALCMFLRVCVCVCASRLVIRGVKWIFYFYYYDFIVFRVSVFCSCSYLVVVVAIVSRFAPLLCARHSHFVIFAKIRYWEGRHDRGTGTITSTPTITTTFTIPLLSLYNITGSTHPWCIPLCCCPCRWWW